jgi:hypothetical protein
VAVTVTTSLILNIIYAPAIVASRTLDSLARNYYEDYYWPKFTKNRDTKDVEAAFEKYEGSGFPPLTLRQLLIFDPSQKSVLKSCDPSATKVIIYPTSPFGKSNYRLEPTLACPKN